VAFRLADIRLAIMEALGRKDEIKQRLKTYRDNPYYYKLPNDVSTHPSWLEWTAPLSEWPKHQNFQGENGKTYRIKVLSSAEAKRLNPKSTSPHRIYVWDDVCQKWVFAGKYCQHAKSQAHKAKLSHEAN
jgi:hypothetical protein